MHALICSNQKSHTSFAPFFFFLHFSHLALALDRLLVVLPLHHSHITQVMTETKRNLFIHSYSQCNVFPSWQSYTIALNASSISLLLLLSWFASRIKMWILFFLLFFFSFIYEFVFHDCIFVTDMIQSQYIGNIDSLTSESIKWDFLLRYNNNNSKKHERSFGF